jgi:CxxC-x17-CxxC domain-containing protein
VTRTPTKIPKRGGHPMSFQDKSIQCFDCGSTFTFSAEEKELFTSKGYNNAPKRCPLCRQARKTRQYGDSANGYKNDRYNDRPRRQTFSAVCTECGRGIRVPFEPYGNLPVYCRDCYRKGCSLQYALNHRATSRYIAATAAVMSD